MLRRVQAKGADNLYHFVNLTYSGNLELKKRWIWQGPNMDALAELYIVLGVGIMF